MQHFNKFIFLTGLVLSINLSADVILSETINCTYKVGQFLTKNEASNANNSTPMHWTFNGLLSDEPIFISGGQKGKVFPKIMDDGIIIYLPFKSGTSTFTIWTTGESFWSKQNKLAGTFNDQHYSSGIYSQQYIGSCEN